MGALTTQVRSTIAAARTRTLEYQERPKPRRDWGAYDAAQTQELPDVLALIGRFVDAVGAPASPTGPRPGRPSTPAGQVAKAMLVQSYLKNSNRVAQGQSAALAAALGLPNGIGYKTIERGYGKPVVKAILEEVLRLTNTPVQGLEKVFSIDGSGMPTTIRDHYSTRRAKQSSKDREEGQWPEAPAGRVYNVAVIGVEYKLLAAWLTTTDRHAKELAQMPEAFARTKALHPEMEQWLGDGLYAGRPQVAVVAEGGVAPRFLPRRNVSLRRLGCDGWVTMLVSMARDPQKWFAEYHMRSISETGFSVINDGTRIRKRIPQRRQTESLLRAVVYNLRRLAQLRYSVGIVPLPDAP